MTDCMHGFDDEMSGGFFIPVGDEVYSQRHGEGGSDETSSEEIDNHDYWPPLHEGASYRVLLNDSEGAASPIHRSLCNSDDNHSSSASLSSCTSLQTSSTTLSRTVSHRSLASLAAATADDHEFSCGNSTGGGDDLHPPREQRRFSLSDQIKAQPLKISFVKQTNGSSGAGESDEREDDVCLWGQFANASRQAPSDHASAQKQKRRAASRTGASPYHISSRVSSKNSSPEHCPTLSVNAALSELHV